MLNSTRNGFKKIFKTKLVVKSNQEKLSINHHNLKFYIKIVMVSA